ncbi:MAG: metallophosphatase [Candidatus Omnitrophica bacterium]|nr:metallophosphatase [Candidatus Omnitrophota bacterium]
MKVFLKSLGLAIIVCAVSVCAYAKEINILFTGDTHAMLYPCNCPIEPDGGVSRRATLIKELRKANPDTLLLDSGGFCAGGLMDEYTQSIQLDMQRTIVNLKAMELMRYDAATIGDDDLNFGRQFLQDNTAKSKTAFLSCNIEAKEKTEPAFSPFIIKEVAGIKIGIIGVTNLLAKDKVPELEIIEPVPAVRRAVGELKARNVDIIVLLSHLGEQADLKLIEEVKGIDVLIIGHSRSKEEVATRAGSTIIARPDWQGRKLDKLSLTFTGNKITDYKAEKLRLSDKIKDDPGMQSILPKCFSDNNCKKGYVFGRCQNPGSMDSSCVFPEVVKAPLYIIAPRDCLICQTKSMAGSLEKLFPGLVISYLDYPGSKAGKFIKDLGITTLPAFILGKDIEKQKEFQDYKENLEFKKDFYILKPYVGGIAYFLDRKPMKNRLDLFISLYDKDARETLEATRDLKPVIHFLIAEDDKGFNAARGNLEVEECLRGVCVQKYYPEKFMDYLSCRARDINSSWWDNCLEGLDTNKIKICAQGEEGRSLLKENIALNRQIKVMSGTTYLLDNHEIFGFKRAPTKAELKQIIKR